MALQFKIGVNSTTSETELIFFMGESRETLQEQIFQAFIKQITEDGRAVNVAQNTENGLVTTKFVFAGTNVDGNITNPAIIGDAFAMLHWELGNTTETNVAKDNGNNFPTRIQGITIVDQANLFKQVGNNQFIYQGTSPQLFKITGTLKLNGSQQSPSLPVKPYVFNENSETSSELNSVTSEVPDNDTGYVLIPLDGMTTLNPGDVIRIGLLHESTTTNGARRVTAIEATVFITQINQ